MDIAWHQYRDAGDGFGTRIHFLDFARSRRCAGFSAIRKRASSR
jgi:hypothetical protein